MKKYVVYFSLGDFGFGMEISAKSEAEAKDVFKKTHPAAVIQHMEKLK